MIQNQKTKQKQKYGDLIKNYKQVSLQKRMELLKDRIENLGKDNRLYPLLIKYFKKLKKLSKKNNYNGEKDCLYFYYMPLTSNPYGCLSSCSRSSSFDCKHCDYHFSNKDKYIDTFFIDDVKRRIIGFNNYNDRNLNHLIDCYFEYITDDLKEHLNKLCDIYYDLRNLRNKSLIDKIICFRFKKIYERLKGNYDTFFTIY
jgi:effector-binding domain-containing protein